MSDTNDLESENTVYRCLVCDYIHEGEFPDGFLCPMCCMSKKWFERIE